jgi:hypothetical protein
VTVTLTLAVKVQLFVLLPPLEHAPDQTASRPLDTRNVIEVPEANEAEPVLPVVTLMPAGVDTTRSPLRPLAVTATITSVAGGSDGGGGVAAAMTVAIAVRAVPSYVAVMVTGVFVLTLVVVTVNPIAVVPAVTVTLAGTLATAGLLLDSDTVAPPTGAPPDNSTNAEVFDPPFTLDGLTVTLCSVTPGAVGVTVIGAVRLTPL